MGRFVVSAGQIKVEHLISDRFSLQDWGKAVETARNPSQCLRAIVNMSQTFVSFAVTNFIFGRERLVTRRLR